MLEHKIQMKTDDMEKHCNLLLTRVLQQLNVNMRNGLEKEILVKEKASKRYINLIYVKESRVQSAEKVWNINIGLSDSGKNSVQSCYYDENVMMIVHDVNVDSVEISYNGESVDFKFEDLEKINKQILVDLIKPLNISDPTIHGKDLLRLEKPIIAIKKECGLEQLQQVAIEFIKKSRKHLPEVFSHQIHLINDYEDHRRFKFSKGVKIYIGENIGEDEDEKFVVNYLGEEDNHKYVISIEAFDESEIEIVVGKVLGKKDNVCIYEFEPIECYTTTGEEFFDMDIVEESLASSLKSSLINKKQRSLMTNK